MNTLNRPVEHIIRAFITLLDTISEYCTLATLPMLDETQSQRLEAIFTQAEQDPLLNFLIDEADHIVGHELGLIDTELIQSQQTKLQQAIDQTWTELVVESIRKSRKQPQPTIDLKQAQVYLKQAGFYQGPIDGEYTPQTQAAFQELRHQLRHQWETHQEQDCTLEDKHCWDLLEYILIKPDAVLSIDPQVSDLLNLEVWKVCGFPNTEFPNTEFPNSIV